MIRASIVALASVALVGLSAIPAGAADECQDVTVCLAPSLNLLPIGPIPIGPIPVQIGPIDFHFCIPLPGFPPCPQ